MSNVPVTDGSATSPTVNNTANVAPPVTATAAAPTTATAAAPSVTASIAAVDASKDATAVKSSSVPEPNPVLANENAEKKSMDITPNAHNGPAATEPALVASPTSPISPASIPSAQQAVVPPPSSTSPEIPIPSTTTTTATAAAHPTQAPPVLYPNTEKLLVELKQKKEMIRRMDEELYYLRHINHDLSEKERIIQERMVMRQKDQKQLLDNYNEHIRARRATQDDPNTIHKKLQKLKVMIKTLSVALAQQCECNTATKAVIGFWVNLHEAIQKMGDPLPVNRIEMLTEKFLMDVLVQNMNYNAFTGLKISQPYTQLQMWFDRYEPSFCTRLRQEIAKVVVSGNVPDSDIQQEIQKLNKRMYNSLYSSLLKAYPFIEQHDLQEKDASKQYSVMLRAMVDQASAIGYAMRGQEVEIAAAAVGEGSEPFDPKTMVDEDGQTSGIISLCISPPIMVYSNQVDVLEKARVLCLPTTTTAPMTTTTATATTTTTTTA
ncbi:glycerol-3-phosphate dehydrogenase [Mucor velutinosus]|uniref:Glycerol-3-phosphate dehydrogenase n=1 Tax=Mucor velutinosus TaxID=708070 RepID=A0AAN7DKM4_9FUNG|nr:glycerol-3-phosphate dehydrogenase [Mucor velutinosus]